MRHQLQLARSAGITGLHQLEKNVLVGQEQPLHRGKAALNRTVTQNDELIAGLRHEVVPQLYHQRAVQGGEASDVDLVVEVVAGSCIGSAKFNQRRRVGGLDQIACYINDAGRITRAEETLIEHRPRNRTAAAQCGIPANEQRAVDIAHRGIKPGDIVVALVEQAEALPCSRGWLVVKIKYNLGRITVHGQVAVQRADS